MSRNVSSVSLISWVMFAINFKFFGCSGP
jgi:hypothetical protein